MSWTASKGTGAEIAGTGVAAELIQESHNLCFTNWVFSHMLMARSAVMLVGAGRKTLVHRIGVGIPRLFFIMG